MIAFDVDGDGDVDLAVGNVGNAANALYLNDGAGMFDQAEAGDFDDGGFASKALIVFDADGDGDLDLAAGDHSDSSSSQGRSTERRRRTVCLGRFRQLWHGTGPSSPLVAFDADGDGDIDLAAPHMVFINDGQGRFSARGFGSRWLTPCHGRPGL